MLPTTPPAPPSPPRIPALTRAQARAVWSVLAAALVVLVLAAVGGAAAFPGARPPRQLGTIFLFVAGPMVALDLGMAYLVTSRMRRRYGPVAPEALAATQVIVASALAVGAALVCCIFFFVAREPLLLLLVLPCAAVLLHWFPSRARWATLVPGAASAAPRARNPLVRE
jgi:hypothetical protein